MNKIILAITGIVVIVGGILVSGAVFTVHQVQQAIVMQFGEPKRVIQDPGLHFKKPFLEDVIFYDGRILELDPPQFEVLLEDRKRINVDAFARYRIVDPLLYFQRVRNEVTARDRLGKLINPSLRRVLAKVKLVDILSPKRAAMMDQIQHDVTEDSRGLGIEIIDIRIGRTDLPPETSQAVFGRMRTERERQARELRAEGKEQAQKTRARADRDKVVLIAEAKRKSEQLRGEGDGERNLILGKAYGQDSEFFQFYKSLDEYKKSLIGNDTTMVLSPDSDFFRFFGDIKGKARK
ncbi:MAG: protease modulator HflC [Rhodospirillaceae bacterium]|jgi:modulator of FtsH protease HflC|nr:protease modulator HflC [Rhodospirillaceae bacterium]MBT5666155.1 protease modulator HflC [Rhodospirillaceae bacterium]